jgi:AsmA protein
LIDKRWVAIGAFILGVFLFVILLLPFFLNADTFRPAIENQLSGALGRNVTLGKLSFSVLEASLTAEDLAIADDPAFSKVPFLQAKALDIGLEILPFLLRREVRITRLNLDTPSIQLIEHENGRWNYSSLGTGPATQGAQQQPISARGVGIGELKITNGNALVSSVPPSKQPFAFSDVNLTVKQFEFDRAIPFDLTANLPGGGTLKTTGDVGPISRQDTSKTPFRGKLELRAFDPVAAGMIDPDKGISAYNDVDGQISSDGTNVTISGKMTASRLQLSSRGSPAQEAVEMDFTILNNLKTQQGTVQDIALHSGSATAHLSGSFQYKPQALVLDLRLSAPDLPIDQFERLLPIVGIHFPSGSSLQGGTFTANIAIAGPVTGAIWTGPVEIKDTKLAGFDLGSKIEGLNGLGTRSGTVIKLMKANVNSTPEITKITDIDAEMPQIGTATGQGSVDPSGELDIRLTAKLSSSNGAGNGRVIPVIITGPATSPSIQANVGVAPR